MGKHPSHSGPQPGLTGRWPCGREQAPSPRGAWGPTPCATSSVLVGRRRWETRTRGLRTWAGAAVPGGRGGVLAGRPAGRLLTAHLSQLGKQRAQVRTPRAPARPEQPPKACGTSRGTHGKTRRPRLQSDRGSPTPSGNRKDGGRLQRHAGRRSHGRRAGGGGAHTGSGPEFCEGTGPAAAPGAAHPARALGTGLIVQGEHLAVPHLPALEVAVCRGRGEAVSAGPPGAAGVGAGPTHLGTPGSTGRRGGKGKCRRWGSPRASRPRSPAAGHKTRPFDRGLAGHPGGQVT